MSEITDLLTESADRLFRDHATAEVHAAVDAGTWPAALWSAMDEAGLTTAALPEPHGSGAAKSDAAAILRRAGFHCVPGPLVETALAGWVLAEAGALPIPGMTVAALDRHHGPLMAEATLRRIAWGGTADAVLAWGDNTELLLLTGGTVQGDRDIAGEPVADLSFNRAALDAARRISPGDRLDPEIVLAWGAVLTGAYLAGALDRVLEDSLVYVQEREQFGRAVGKFQAVQQLLAEAAGEVAAAGAIADAAAEALDDPDFSRLPLIAAAAKARIGEAAGRVAQICHQVHGAIGFTREFALHRATRRLWRGRDAFGNERYWQERLGAAALAAGGDGLWPLLTAL